MSYDFNLAERINRILTDKNISFEEKKMMSGLCFLVNDKMCAGIIKNKLMCRINPEIYDQILKREGVKEMTFTGRPMRGYIFVEPGVIDEDKDLENWLQLCLDFNPLAKSGKIKK